MGGTKWPSITSTWITRAPCFACARISDRIRSRRGSVSRSTNVIAAATAGCTRAISAWSACATARYAGWPSRPEPRAVQVAGPGLVELVGHAGAQLGAERLPLDREQAVALEVAEGAIVRHHL